ncbi:hypothetical protein KV580_10030 [Pseudomonas chlororaphis]|nr:hypothetical protein [Pseudomonas chlororaphis]
MARRALCVHRQLADMFTIRRQQLEAFRQAKLDQFRTSAIAHLSNWQTDSGSDRQASIPAIVDEGMAAAERYGLLTATHRLAFIECVWLHGPAFYKEQPWAAALLRNDALSPAQLFARLRAGANGNP